MRILGGAKPRSATGAGEEGARGAAGTPARGRGAEEARARGSRGGAEATPATARLLRLPRKGAWDGETSRCRAAEEEGTDARSATRGIPTAARGSTRRWTSRTQSGAGGRRRWLPTSSCCCCCCCYEYNLKTGGRGGPWPPLPPLPLSPPFPGGKGTPFH